MKYNINRNRPPLTDTDLSAERNFYKVLRKYNGLKIPFYRSGRFLASSSAIVVSASVMLIFLFDNNDKAGKPSFISPPFAQAVIATDSFTVQADSAVDILYKSGSKIHVPAHAFKDRTGKLIEGKVTLTYREFHDQKDIFLSGIPMTYDSAGRTYVFESAGMMEIAASQNNEPLQANQDKPIQVDMVSNTKEDKYNTYYLDTVSKKWVNLNTPNLADNMGDTGNSIVEEHKETPEEKKSAEEVKRSEAAVIAIERAKPVPIVIADKSKTQFHIVVDPNEFPEIAIYKGVHFQVKDERSFDEASAKIEWEDVKLKKLNGIDYEVIFSKGKRTFNVVATPVVEEKDMGAAKKVYDKKFAEYKTKLSERISAETQAREAYEAQAKIAKAQMAAAMAKQKEMDEIYESRMTKTQLVYRTFSVNNFGIYNCDNPGIWPSEVEVVASLTDENGVNLKLSNLNLVEKGINGVFPYQVANGECHHFKFDSRCNNILWAVTTDNKLAIVDVNSFKAQQGRYGKVQFRFKVIDKNFKSSDEVKKYLEI